MQNKSHRILARDQCVSNDTWETGMNNNDLIIGPSGAGKTRGYVIPNLLQANESFVITDTKGNLCQLTGPILEKRGYKVMEINLADCEKSPCGYNPMDYIRADYEGSFQFLRYERRSGPWRKSAEKTKAGAVFFGPARASGQTGAIAISTSTPTANRSFYIRGNWSPMTRCPRANGRIFLSARRRKIYSKTSLTASTMRART